MSDWTEADDARLVGMVRARITRAEIARILGRSPGAIAARSKKIGLVKIVDPKKRYRRPSRTHLGHMSISAALDVGS